MKFSLVFGFLAVGVILGAVLLFRSSPGKTTGKSSPKLPSKTRSKPQKLVIGSRRPQENVPPLPVDPAMDSMRKAVRKYVTKNPGLTAQVMQDWMQNKK
jgi:flagellar biosynthesis/type III secretory pathway M-ring protein FliF/YscJ